MARHYVCFRSSFDGSSREGTISHETIDKVMTLCGRKVADAVTLESDSNDLGPCCLTCSKAARRNKEKS
jgi:hypothetical protein